MLWQVSQTMHANTLNFVWTIPRQMIPSASVMPTRPWRELSCWMETRKMLLRIYLMLAGMLNRLPILRIGNC